MSEKARRSKRDWQPYLLQEEREMLHKIEAEKKALDERRRHLANERRLIRDRAGQRFVLAQERDAQPELFQTTGQKVDSSRQREACE